MYIEDLCMDLADDPDKVERVLNSKHPFDGPGALSHLDEILGIKRKELDPRGVLFDTWVSSQEEGEELLGYLKRNT